MRVREAFLSGWGRHLRQTIMLSSFASAEMNALFNRACVNIAGKLRLRPVYEVGSVPLDKDRNMLVSACMDDFACTDAWLDICSGNRSMEREFVTDRTFFESMLSTTSGHNLRPRYHHELILFVCCGLCLQL